MSHVCVASFPYGEMTQPCSLSRVGANDKHSCSTPKAFPLLVVAKNPASNVDGIKTSISEPSRK